jgi:hypothetical protein
MDEHTRRARLEEHRAFVEDSLRRADELERRASVAVAAHIRQVGIERAAVTRSGRGGEAELFATMDTLVAALQANLIATRNFRLAIEQLATAESEPGSSRLSRWFVRRSLTKSLATLERDAITAEERLAVALARWETRPRWLH